MVPARAAAVAKMRAIDLIMGRDLKQPVGQVHRRCMVAVLLALAVPAGAAEPAALLLPPPGGQPQAIDFGSDPLLSRLHAPGAGDDFRDRIADAVRGYPGVAAAAAGSDIADASRRQARAALFPQLSASIVSSRSLDRGFSGDNALVESLAPRGRTDAQVGVDQLLWDFGSTSGRIAGGAARLRAARADADKAATETALAAVAAWVQVAEYRTLVDLAEALVARHRGILDDTRTRMTAGLGSGADVARAEAGLADAITAANRQARNLASVRARYRELFGAEAPARPVRPERPLSVAGDAVAAAELSHRSPAVVAALAGAEANRADARAVRADALPRLSGGVVATRYNAFGDGNNYDVRGQLTLRQSLSAGGAEAARHAEAQARARAAGFASDQAVGEAERDASAAFADAALLDASVAAMEDAYRANRRSRDSMAEQFRLSRGALTDLLRSEQDYFAAAAALVQGSSDRDLARFTLLARTGELLRFLGIAADRPEKPAPTPAFHPATAG